MLKVIKAQVVMKMTKLEELIKELCPNGVEYVALGKVTHLLRGKRLTKMQLLGDGKYPVYQSLSIQGE